ncbi:MAG: hypothetical protein II951_10400 [Bacteroidales bacterium]|nr:hypothetical protein [Bacteroidales bacterium]
MKTILKGLILLVSLLNFSSAYAETVSVWKNGEKLLSIDSYFVDSIAFHKNVKAQESADVIDLGLSVKWASCNLGASKPEELGNLYAWGETSTKTSYGWSDYKYCNGSYNKLTKYVREKHAADYGYNGFFDDKTTLDPDDDAATAALGDKWRIPTADDWRELLNNSSWEWTQLNGIYGYKVTSTKTGFEDKYIFLPGDNTSSHDGAYASSSLSFEPQSASGLYFSESGTYLSYGMRCLGTSVRPVTTAAESSPSPSADESGTLATCVWSRGVNLMESIATEVDSISFSSVAVEEGDGLVDLGLSVKWASCNLGAAKPEEIGDYFAWGETEVKDLYNWTTYKWGSAKDKLTKYCTKDENAYPQPSEYYL